MMSKNIPYNAEDYDFDDEYEYGERRHGARRFKVERKEHDKKKRWQRDYRDEYDEYEDDRR